MTEFEEIDKDKYSKFFWEGKENRIIRLWVYTQRGLSVFNEFKYFILLIATGYGFVRLVGSLGMVLTILGVGIPTGIWILIMLGRWQINRAAKVEQYIATIHGNILKFNDYNIKVRTLKTLENIEKKLKS